MNSELDFDQIFKTFLSSGPEGITEIVGENPAFTKDPRICGLAALSFFYRAETGNNFKSIGNQWLGHGLSLQSVGNIYLIGAKIVRDFYVLNKDAQEVSPLLAEANQIEPNNPITKNLKLSIDKSISKDEKIKQYGELTEAFPDFGFAWLRLGAIYLGEKEMEKAFFALKKGLALFPDSVYGLSNMGVYYYQIAIFESEKQRRHRTFQRFANFDEDVKEERETLEQAIKEKEHRLDLAKNYFERSLLLDPNQPECLFFLGMIEAARENWTRAIYYMNKGKELNPDIGTRSDFAYITQEFSKLNTKSGLTKIQSELVERHREYALNGKRVYEATDSKFRTWNETVHNHFIHNLMPKLKERGEEFIEYWPAYLFWGLGVTHKQWNDRIYRHTLGSFGTGYLCMTDKAVYFTSIDKLSKEFSALLEGAKGFVLDVLKGVAGERDSRRRYEGDETWRVKFDSILGAEIGTNEDQRKVLFVTGSSRNNWEVQSLFSDSLEEMQAGFEMGMDDRLSQIFGRESNN